MTVVKDGSYKTPTREQRVYSITLQDSNISF